ncbi:MAG TPA: sugar ABC transporter permease, partial [Ruminococcaceae bacterium]|nr:sugar ABC transporter permease [Oscillospiraceae bacterium]
GLQSISASLYEVAKVEGANAWVAFWKITLPMLSPMLLVNLIYTVIDSYINSSNPLFKLIDSVSLEFDYVAAMSVFSFAAIFLIIGIVYFILNRWVYYAVD